MRIYRLAHAIVSRFSAMDETEANDLNLEAMNAYNDALDNAKFKIKHNDNVEKAKAGLHVDKDGEVGMDASAQKKLPITISDKLVLLAERWYMRYLFAVLYIFAVPSIKDYMNGVSGKEDEDDAEDFEEMMKFMKAYSRMKR